jgi:lipopolysaccharide biosynthesis glycosyltransferase
MKENTHPAAVIAIDDKYVLPLITMLKQLENSLIQDIVVISDPAELREESLELIRFAANLFRLTVTSLRLQAPDLRVANQYAGGAHISKTAFLKLKALDIPELKSRYLILDVDLFLEMGWQAIWENNREQFKFILATRDEGVIPSQNNPNHSMRDTKNGYFNSGVMLINPTNRPAFLESTSFESLLKRYHELGFEYGDQCIMNFLFGEHYDCLDRKFNYLEFSGRPKGSSPLIWHFAGAGYKPWQMPRSAIARLLILRNRNLSPFFSYLKLHYRVQRILRRQLRKERSEHLMIFESLVKAERLNRRRFRSFVLARIEINPHISPILSSMKNLIFHIRNRPC